MDRRIQHHPVLGAIAPGKTLTFQYNGKPYTALHGDTVAAALLAHGVRQLRVHEESGSPRGFYCNIGHCYECRVTINNRPGVRACLTLVEADMEVFSGERLPAPLKHPKAKDSSEGRDSHLIAERTE